VRDCVRLIIVAVRDGVSLFRADMHHWLRKRVERELPIPKEVDEYRRMVSSGDGLPMLRLRWSRLGLCADDGRPHWHKPQADAKEPGSCAQCARHVQITTWLSTFTLAPGTEAGFGYKKPKKNTHTGLGCCHSRSVLSSVPRVGSRNGHRNQGFQSLETREPAAGTEDNVASLTNPLGAFFGSG
jgi:hypothetical protein